MNLKIDLVAYEGIGTPSSIDESYEDSPGAYVGWYIDETNHLVRLEFQCEPTLPSSYNADYKLKVESVGSGKDVSRFGTIVQ